MHTYTHKMYIHIHTHTYTQTVIIGSGPTGLTVAIMLARRGWKDITVLDRLPPPPPIDSPDWANPGLCIHT